MKNQTKAILASTMILALALSSVAGVTYSWFSDTEETEFEIGTGNINISVSLKNTTINEPMANLGIQQITPGQVGITHTYELIVSNSGCTVPAIVSAYVILERYLAYYSEVNEQGETEKKYGEVYAIYNGDKTINHFETTGGEDGFFYSNNDRQTNTTGALSFGDDKALLKSTGSVKLGNHSVFISGSDNKFTEKSANGEYEIRYVEYKYYIGNLVVNSNVFGDDSPKLTFSVNYRDDYKPNAVKELYVRTTATQINADCHTTQLKYDPETSLYKASTAVEGAKPEVFLKSDLSIVIEPETLTGINTIEVFISETSSLINLSIKYYDTNDNLISFNPPGDLTIQFSSDGLSGMIKAPASKMIYEISTGGQTS